MILENFYRNLFSWESASYHLRHCNAIMYLSENESFCAIGSYYI